MMEARVEKRETGETTAALWVLGILLAVLVVLLLGIWLWTRRPAVAAGAAGARGASGEIGATGMRTGQPAAVRALESLDGRKVEIFDGRRGVVLCFFTLSCPGCVDEGDDFRELVARAAERNVRVFLVTGNEAPAAIGRYAKANGIEDLPILHDPSGKVFERFHLVGVPEYLYFDAGGRLLNRSVGDSAPQGFTPRQRAETILMLKPAGGAAGAARAPGKWGS
jgi:peroxiredoxin